MTSDKYNSSIVIPRERSERVAMLRRNDNARRSAACAELRVDGQMNACDDSRRMAVSLSDSGALTKPARWRMARRLAPSTRRSSMCACLSERLSMRRGSELMRG
jgi:hypothetical protein